ncbi:MAG: cytidylate kinase-like family protein [Candidatus Sumerlaeia bacterium]|nr:cytidylate kinase-like family protein [Candidatus Sumerlaeia bacterium]
MTGQGRRAPIGEHRLIERQLGPCDRLAAFLKSQSHTKPRTQPTPPPVITISGLIGSGRGRLGKALADELGYELVGREILDAVASDLKCQRELLENLDERMRSNVEVLLESWLRGRAIEKEDYIQALFRVVGSVAERGGAVIIGRAAGLILGPRAGLRICLVASVEQRVGRVRETRGLSEKEAREFVAERDREQSRFCRRYFGCEITDPSVHDLVINTDRIAPESAVPVVRAALAARR